MEPTEFGTFHPLRQEYLCDVEDFSSLMKLTKGRPFTDWNADIDTIDPHNIATWFPRDNHRMAFYGAAEQEGLTYSDLHNQINACPKYRRKTTVAVLLPLERRPELAVVLVALLAQNNVCVAPLDSNTSPARLTSTIKQLGCTGIVSTPEILDNIGWKETLTELHDVRCVESAGTKAGAVYWTVLHQETKSYTSAAIATSVLGTHEPKMLLRTSGTTAGPKVVALQSSHLIHYGTCLALGLGLNPQDTACNAMPLFHIGGIASALLCVLVCGSSAIMIPGPFDPHGFLDRLDPASDTSPTWYYAAPTMHKALLLAAKSRGQAYVPNNLRLIRSAAAHLPHQTAVELAKLFHTSVFPTYGMTECMPICIPSEAVVWNRESKVIDTVGRPVGISVSIVDASGEPLPYGSIGEIAVKGPGALESYVNISPSKTHTPQGWLKTGDVGFLDHHGRLFIKGRSKEMIKRGGEQVWPNEIDAVVQTVPGVKTAVTFAVPNELWGEEVAVAVVLQTEGISIEAMKQQIMKTCRSKLDEFAVPRQIIVVNSTDDLIKGATGKYLRTKMAEHLNAKAADTGAMRLWQSAEKSLNVQAETETTVPSTVIKPSSALNGIRFVAACFVVQLHTGFFPNLGWTKIQSFTVSMQIFFFLLGFQTTCNVQNEVLSTWSSFIGTKIGSMHALFVVAQFFGLPAFFTFHCGESGFQAMFRERTCANPGLLAGWGSWFAFQLSTGMAGKKDDVVRTTWFQSIAYIFLAMFPLLDKRVREIDTPKLLRLLVFLAVTSVLLPSIVLELLGLEDFHFSIATWWPHLGASVVLGHLFKRIQSERATANRLSDNPFYKNPRFWAVVTDCMSVLFLLFEVAVVIGPTCAYMDVETFQLMRPFDEINEEDLEEFYGDTAVWACDITWDEYTDFVHEDGESWLSLGRLEGGMTEWFASYRIASPLVMIWLFGLAWGQSFTARLMNSSVLQSLAPLSYSVYLLHIPVSRYYWLWTEGFEAKEWWNKVGDFPVPVPVIGVVWVIVLSVLVGYAIDRNIIAHVMPYTVKLGIYFCELFSCLLFGTPKDGTLESNKLSLLEDKVYGLVQATSGARVTPATRLFDLGLDSLGVTAFMGNLRARLPAEAVAGLTLTQLVQMETVQDLISFLSKKEQSVQNQKNNRKPVFKRSPSDETAFLSSSSSSEEDSLEGRSA